MKLNLCCLINAITKCKHCGYSLCRECYEKVVGMGTSTLFGEGMNMVADYHYNYSKCFGICRDLDYPPTDDEEMKDKKERFYAQQKKVSPLSNQT